MNEVLNNVLETVKASVKKIYGYKCKYDCIDEFKFAKKHVQIERSTGYVLCCRFNQNGRK
jgi:hypothetical protein